MSLNKTESEELNPGAPGSSAPDAMPANNGAAKAFAAEKKGKSERTAGLKLFDVFLYPVLTNFGVFAISVMATYLTSHGDKMGGRVGQFFYSRGEWFKEKAGRAGLSPDQADMAKMVFFSFADGSLLAPLVKGLEDRREKIAKRIDTFLGTKPEDESVYASEPKQGWFSVLAGRFATAAIVVPTAVVLDKAGLNKKLFGDPGLKMGDAFKEKFPRMAEKFQRFDLRDLFKVGLFEAFYTSVCTAGLYISSRFIARKTDKGADKTGEAYAAEPQGAALKSDLTYLGPVEVKPNSKASASKEKQWTEVAQSGRDTQKQTPSTSSLDWRDRVQKDEKKGLSLVS